jgi:neutral trehalase
MASLQETGQQWDAPNAWPPLQALLAEGLATYGGAPLLVMSAACCMLLTCMTVLVAQRMSCVQSRTAKVEGACTGWYVCMHANALSFKKGKKVM